MQCGCSRGHQFLVQNDAEMQRIMANGCPQCAQENLNRQSDWAFLAPMIKKAVLEALAEHDAKKGPFGP